MIFLFLLALMGLIAFALHKKVLGQQALIPILLALYAFSLLPSVSVPFIIDDLDHLANLREAMDRGNPWGWILTPHNEHFMPLLKIIYYFSYKNFWVNPEFFHGIIILVAMLNVWLALRLFKIFSTNPLVSLIGMTVLIGSNLTDASLFIICDSHIHFSIFFLLLMMNLQWKFYQSGRSFWFVLITLSTLAAPLTFGLSHVSIVVAFLFEKYCLRDESKKRMGSTMPAVFVGWLLGLFPYFYYANTIIHTPHYHDVGATSALGAIKWPLSVKYFFQFVVNDVIPSLTANIYFSMGLFFIGAWVLLQRDNQFQWKKLLPFLAFGLLPTIIVSLLRAPWGEKALQYARYYVYPLFALTFLYVIFVNRIFQKYEKFIESKTLWICLICFFVITQATNERYQRSSRVALETKTIIQSFYLEYTFAFFEYFKVYPDKKLSLKNNYVVFPKSPALILKNGENPTLTRYVRHYDFFARYLLPKKIRMNIDWNAPNSDKDFIDFLQRPEFKGRFKNFLKML